MNKILNNFCVCGHVENIHNGWSDGQENEYPTGCNFRDGMCDCQEFKQDNLKYLEMKYEKLNGSHK